MKTHPETIAYVRRIVSRPGMFVGDFDVREIETLLHGFEAGLLAAWAFGNESKFNSEFGEFVCERTGLSGSLGWARALIDEYGSGKESYDAFCEFLRAAFPSEFSHGGSHAAER
jgi:hypothetical protein